MRWLDCRRMPEKPWLNNTSGNRPAATAASRFASMVNVAGMCAVSSLVMFGGTKSRTS